MLQSVPQCTLAAHGNVSRRTSSSVHTTHAHTPERTTLAAWGGVQGVGQLTIRADTQPKHSARQNVVPEQEARGTHRLKSLHAAEQ